MDTVPLQVIVHTEIALQDPNRIKPMNYQVFCKNIAKLCPQMILGPEKNDGQYYLYFTGGELSCRETMGCLQMETDWCRKCILKSTTHRNKLILESLCPTKVFSQITAASLHITSALYRTTFPGPEIPGSHSSNSYSSTRQPLRIRA